MRLRTANNRRRADARMKRRRAWTRRWAARMCIVLFPPPRPWFQLDA